MMTALVLGLSFPGTDTATTAFKPVMAAENDWSGVRNVATMARQSSVYFNQFYRVIQQMGFFLNFKISITIPVVDRDWIVKIRTSQPSAASSSVDGSVTYQHRIQISVNGTTAFQLFFDSANGSTIGNGCLVKIRPYYFDNKDFSSTAVLEGRVKMDGTDVVLFVTASGDPMADATHAWVHSGRVKMTYTNSRYEVTGLAWAGVDGTDKYKACGGGAGDGFYTIAFIANGASPNESTSLWGWDASVRSNQVCGAANTSNYGYYRSTSPYFESDGNTADDGIHPDIADVQAIYTGMDATEFAEATIKSPGITLTTW